MKHITTNTCRTVVVPSFLKYDNNHSQEDALPCIKWLISTRYYVFGEKKESYKSAWIMFYYVYKTSASTRGSILQFAMHIVAHLGVFAFLFQVFQEDRGIIMKLCCYTQLGLLILCFAFYLALFALDSIALLSIKRNAIGLEGELQGKICIKDDRVYKSAEIGDKTKVYHRIFGVRYFELDVKDKEDDHRLGEDEGISTQVLNICFGIAMIVIECLTVAYVYNNTQ